MDIFNMKEINECNRQRMNEIVFKMLTDLAKKKNKTVEEVKQELLLKWKNPYPLNLDDEFILRKLDELYSPIIDIIKNQYETKIEELNKKIVELNRDNLIIADRVHNDGLKDLAKISKQYDENTDRLNKENNNLKQIIKLLCESI
jgi:benzoyl-CoA reductase/2-hydroxyglutaryl-CoA dehydratase subunit BcrC/BadD/HgdB